MKRGRWYSMVIVGLCVGGCEGKPGLLTDFESTAVDDSSGGEPETTGDTTAAATTSGDPPEPTSEGDGSSGGPGEGVVACENAIGEIGEVDLEVTFDPPVAGGSIELAANCWVFATGVGSVILECDVTTHGVESQIGIDFKVEDVLMASGDNGGGTVTLWYVRRFGQDASESVVVRDDSDGSVWFAVHEGNGQVPDLSGEDKVGEVEGFFAPYRFEKLESDCGIPTMGCGEVQRTALRFTHDEAPGELVLFDHRMGTFGPEHRIKVGAATKSIGSCDGETFGTNDFVIVRPAE